MAPFPEAVNAWQCVSLISPLVALAANAMAQLMLFRVRRGTQFFRSIVQSAGVGATAGLALTAALIVTRSAPAGTLLPTLVVNALTYLALSYCYYHFVQLGQTSVRIRVFEEIAASEHGLTVEEIAARYDNNALMQMRLHRLLESGDIVQRNGRYFAGRSRLVHIANVLFAAKRLILGRSSEFDEVVSQETDAHGPAPRKDGTPQR